MKKKNVILIIIGILILVSLYFIYKTLNLNHHDKYTQNNNDKYIQTDNEYLDLKQYDMMLNIDTDNSKISGSVKMDIKNGTNDVLKEIHIRNYAANFVSSYIDSFAVNNNSLKYCNSKDDSSIIIVYLDSPLKKDEDISLSMNFNTDIPKKKSKFGYTIFNNYIYYNLSFCFPTLSYYDNTWHDYPYTNESSESNLTDVSDYNVEIHIPNNFTVAATGEETINNNVVNVKGNNLREFSMVASNGLVNYSEKINNVDINYYYLKEKNNEKWNKLIFESEKESFKLYEKLLGKYPYNELDVVQTFMDSAGAMEYPGLAMVGFPDLSEVTNLDNHLDTIENHANSVAHEVAHMWFYGAVGNDPYMEPWLDEGLAEFCEDILYVESKMNNKEKEKFYELQDDYIKQVIEKKFIINKNYNYYNKGADDYSYSFYVYDGGKSFLYELRKTMGDEQFYKMLQDYYATYKFKIVTTKNFYDKVIEYDNSSKVKKILSKYLEV